MSGIVRTNISRCDRSIVDGFRKLPTSIVSDSMNRANAMRSCIKPVKPGTPFVGTAITIQSMPGCNLLSHKAIYLAEPGDVLVIDARGHLDTAVWGFLQTRASQIRGLAGVVIDGSVRDSAEIRESGFPVYCAGISPLGPHKGWGDSVNVSIQCAGVPVEPGDIVIGDDDGVAVVPRLRANEVLKESLERVKMEQEWFRRLESGEATLSILDMDSKIRSFGVIEE